MLPTIKFRSLSLACLTLVVTFSASELASAPAPGEIFRDCADCPEMVVIPAGNFRMGDLNGEGGWNEKPVHEVRIAQPFAMGRYEVTFAEYDRYAQATGKEKPVDGGGWGRGNHPVAYVSWQDAQGYVKWLSQETGQSYRLPSEAEWEYAARAGSTTKHYWGNNPSGRYANIAKFDSGGYIIDDGNRVAAPVGSLQPNQFGLYDMSGNVLELVEDCWHNNNYQGAPVDGSAWVKGGNCKIRPARGGSFINGLSSARSAARHYRIGVTNIGGALGFRLARTL